MAKKNVPGLPAFFYYELAGKKVGGIQKRNKLRMFCWKDALIGDGNQRGDFPEEGTGRPQVYHSLRRP